MNQDDLSNNFESLQNGKEIKKDKEFILCDICASKIDADSKFCVCCGSKVVKKEKFDIDNYEIDESEYEIDDEDESYRYADDEELDTIDSSVEIVNEEVLDGENEENRELYEEYNLENKESKEKIETSLKRVKNANLNALLPEILNINLKEGLLLMNNKINGFTSDATLLGVESRSSAPIRFYRDDNMESNIKGIYPIGEGAGYAGGIM